jgi:hypothetical protein
MKRTIAIICNIVVGGVVACLSLGSASVEAQPIGDRFEDGYQSGYVAGYEQGRDEQVTYRDVITYVDREVVKYVDREIITYVDREVINYVDREVTVNLTPALRDFDNLGELEIWLALDDTSEFVFFFADASGKVAPGERYDCDDYARQLQQRAAESGFLLSLAILPDKAGLHMVNLAVIGGKVYHIEPQTDEYRYYCDLD